MGFLRQGNQSPSVVPKVTGLQIQTSSNAVPIPIMYGTNKIAPNAIWTGGFFAIPQYQKSGGKGGGNGPVQGYTYYTSFALGVCEGPVTYYLATLIGQNYYFGLQGAGLEQLTFGYTPQTPWGYLTANFPSQALGYNGLSYVGAYNYNLGSSPSLPQFSFVVESFASTFGGNVVNGLDADPALVIQDFLTNAQYGVLFPAASIDATTLLGSSGDSTYQTYCRAVGIALSPVLANQEAANSIIARWLQLTNATAVWSGGKLKFIPYGDTSVTGASNIGPITFNPNVTPIYNLGDDDFVHEDGKDPLEVVRSDPYASFNWQRMQINSRNYGVNYDAVPIEAWDQNAIELYGLRMAPDITASEICSQYVAQTSVQLILQRGLSIRNTYNFKLSFEYCLLEPMDLVTVTDTLLGLTNVAIRITSIEEDDAGLLSVTAEEFPAGIATAALYSVQTKTPNSTNQAVVPARVNPPILYEPPAALTGGVAQVFAAVSGGVATAYLLAEDGSTGQHYAFQAVASSQSSGVTITFSSYAQAAPRTAVGFDLFDGSVFQTVDFNLATAAVGATSAGITGASISAVGGGWYQISASYVMAAAGVPDIFIIIENPVGTQVYTGTPGDGVYIWGTAYSWTNAAAGTGQAPSFLPAFTVVAGATIAVNSAATPEGVPGVADPNWGGAFVWISTDNTTYGQIGTVLAPSRQGTLTAALPLPSGANPDIVNTLSVSLVESGGALASGTNADAQNGVTLCLVDKELLAYATAALTGTNAYNLTYLYRGLYGTTPAAHASGAPFARIDGAVFQYPLPAAYVGVPLFLKLQSFNIFGQAVEDLSECTVYPYTPTGAGQPIGPVTQALVLGQSLDFGLASAAVSETDQWGIVTDGFILAKADLGRGTL